MGNAPPADLLAPRSGIKKADRALAGAAVDAFVGALGGRQALITRLQIASGDPAVDHVLALLDDPLYAGWSLPDLCQHAALTVADFLRAYQRAMIAVGEIAATHVIAEGVIAVVQDVMRRAAPHDEPCPCGAPTVVPPAGSPPCRTCHGTGSARIFPDLDRQKVALDLAKLLPKSGGIAIQQNTIVTPSAPAGGGSLADLQAAVHRILHPRRPAAPSSPAPVIDRPPIAEAG